MFSSVLCGLASIISCVGRPTLPQMVWRTYLSLSLVGTWLCLPCKLETSSSSSHFSPPGKLSISLALGACCRLRNKRFFLLFWHLSSKLFFLFSWPQIISIFSFCCFCFSDISCNCTCWFSFHLVCGQLITCSVPLSQLHDSTHFLGY